MKIFKILTGFTKPIIKATAKVGILTIMLTGTIHAQKKMDMVPAEVNRITIEKGALEKLVNFHKDRLGGGPVSIYLYARQPLASRSAYVSRIHETWNLISPDIDAGSGAWMIRPAGYPSRELLGFAILVVPFERYPTCSFNFCSYEDVEKKKKNIAVYIDFDTDQFNRARTGQVVIPEPKGFVNELHMFSRTTDRVTDSRGAVRDTTLYISSEPPYCWMDHGALASHAPPGKTW